jgi:aminoglycoside 3-N-acetyltransferase
MNETDFIASFSANLLALGVRPGGVLLVHSSLKSMGHVPGGPETVIQGLLKTLGDAGTLLLPSLTYETVTRHKPVFDVRATPSCVGAITEYFRTRPGTLRSLHPTHSVCGIGHLAKELTAKQALDSTPCGPNSPFRLLPEIKGQILMLGCGLRPNTSMHAIEELVVPPYLFNPPIIYTLTDGHGKTYQKRYTIHNFVSWLQRYDRVAEVLTKPALRFGIVAGAKTYLIEARSLWKSVLSALRNDPFSFVERVN